MHCKCKTNAQEIIPQLLVQPLSNTHLASISTQHQASSLFNAAPMIFLLQQHTRFSKRKKYYTASQALEARARPRRDLALGFSSSSSSSSESSSLTADFRAAFFEGALAFVAVFLVLAGGSSSSSSLTLLLLLLAVFAFLVVFVMGASSSLSSSSATLRARFLVFLAGASSSPSWYW